jgi:hypothetical protein
MTGRFRSTTRLAAAVRDHRPDVVYLRYDLFLPPPLGLFHDFPVIVEVNTDDRAEARLVRSRGGRLYNFVNRQILLRSASGLVYVSGDLARSPRFTPFGKPGVVIPNGADLARIQPLASSRNERVRAVFMGTARQPWHGIDKFLWLAGQLPEVDFDIVGFRPDDLPQRPPPNVTAHGVLARAEYEPILARSDVGIGTLAQHRRCFDETSTLKVPEYLAYGLPVVIGYEDTALIGLDEWFILRLPNRESNVRDNLDRIRAFIAGVKGRRVPREAVEQRIGAHAREADRLRFMQTVIGACNAQTR